MRFDKISELIENRLDPFELKRLSDKLQIHDDVKLTFDDTLYAFKQLLDEDFEDVIELGFNKLDISNDG